MCVIYDMSVSVGHACLHDLTGSGLTLAVFDVDDVLVVEPVSDDDAGSGTV